MCMLLLVAGSPVGGHRPSLHFAGGVLENQVSKLEPHGHADVQLFVWLSFSAPPGVLGAVPAQCLHIPRRNVHLADSSQPECSKCSSLDAKRGNC